MHLERAGTVRNADACPVGESSSQLCLGYLLPRFQGSNGNIGNVLIAMCVSLAHIMQASLEAFPSRLTKCPEDCE